jgi:hypothetical protein
MNTTEEMYFLNYLKPRLDEGDLSKVFFEKLRFIYVHSDKDTKRKEATYTPDFYCLCSDGTIEIHEVKGMEDEADRLKIKVCSELFPEFKWVMAHSGRNKTFTMEEF